MRNFPYNDSEENHFQEILHEFENSLSSNRSNYFDIEDLEMVIDYYLDTEENEKAMKAYHYGLLIHPNNPILRAKKAKILMKNGEYQRALIQIQNNPTDDIEHLAIQAECYLQLGHTKKAIDYFDEYVAKNDKEERAPACKDIADMFIAKNLIDNARHFINKGIYYSSSNDSDLFVMLAQVNEMTNNKPEAAKAYNKALDADPYNNYIWYMLGALYFDMSEYKKAIEAYDFCLAIDESNENSTLIYLNKAHCLYNLDKFKEAGEYYLKYLEDYPDDDQIWQYVGECQQNDGQNAEAFNSFKKATHYNKENVEAWVGCTMCMMENEDYEKALRYINKAARLKNNDTDILNYQGEVLTRLGEKTEDSNYFERARKIYLKSLKLNDNQADIWMQLGHLHLQFYFFEEAKYYYEKAYKLNPDIENVTLFLAMAYFNLNDKEKTMYYFNLAEQKYPDAKSIFISIFPEVSALLNQKTKK